MAMLELIKSTVIIIIIIMSIIKMGHVSNSVLLFL